MPNSQCHWSATQLVAAVATNLWVSVTECIQNPVFPNVASTCINYFGDFQTSWTLEAQVTDVMNSQTPSDALAESVRAFVSDLSRVQGMVNQHGQYKSNIFCERYLKMNSISPSALGHPTPYSNPRRQNHERFMFSGKIDISHIRCCNDTWVPGSNSLQLFQRQAQNQTCKCNHIATLEAFSTYRSYSTGLGKHRQANRWLPSKWARYARRFLSVSFAAEGTNILDHGISDATTHAQACRDISACLNSALSTSSNYCISDS